MTDIPEDIILAAKICWMEMPAQPVGDRDAFCVELIAKAIREERDRKLTPVCIGQESIQKLAADGEVTFESGVTLIAASNLFHKDPYSVEA